MRPPVGLNDILRTMSRIRATLDSLRKREAGEVECPAGDFPYSVRLSNFRPGDRIKVVASGWVQGDAVRGVTLHTEVTHDGEGHVLALRARDPSGDPIPSEAVVHASWIAMA